MGKVMERLKKAIPLILPLFLFFFLPLESICNARERDEGLLADTGVSNESPPSPLSSVHSAPVPDFRKIPSPTKKAFPDKKREGTVIDEYKGHSCLFLEDILHSLYGKTFPRSLARSKSLHLGKAGSGDLFQPEPFFWGVEPFLARNRAWEHGLLLPRETLLSYSKTLKERGVLISEDDEDTGHSFLLPGAKAFSLETESPSSLPYPPAEGSEKEGENSPFFSQYRVGTNGTFQIFFNEFQQRFRAEQEDPFSKMNLLSPRDMHFFIARQGEMGKLSLSFPELDEYSMAYLRDFRSITLLATRDSIKDRGVVGEITENLETFLENFKASLDWRVGEGAPRIESRGGVLKRIPLVSKERNRKNSKDKPFHSYVKASFRTRGSTLIGELELLEGFTVGEWNLGPRLVLKPFSEEVKVWAFQFDSSSNAKRGCSGRKGGVRILLLGGEMYAKGDKVPLIRDVRDKWRINFFNVCVRF